MNDVIEKIVYAVVKALLDWLDKRRTNTMQSGAKPLPPDAIAFRDYLNKWLQDKSGDSGQK